jgi:hypothetical protein
MKFEVIDELTGEVVFTSDSSEEAIDWAEDNYLDYTGGEEMDPDEVFYINTRKE